MSPIFGEKEPKEVFEENVKKAEDAFAYGRYERALEHIRKAGEFAGTCQLHQEELVGLWDLNGRILDRLGRYEEALECYDRAVSINPENALNSHLNRLVPLTCLEKWQELVKQCHKVLAILSEERGKKHGGIEDKGKEKEKGMWQRTTLDQIESMVWTRKGIALSCSNRLEEALECYDKSLELDPENVDTLVNKAHAYGLQGKFEEMSTVLVKGYNVHNGRFMKILPPPADPDHFLRLLRAIADYWEKNKVPIKVSWRQCPICTHTSTLRIHAIVQYERNGKMWTQEFGPPLCRSLTNGIARECISEVSMNERILGILNAIWTHTWKPNYRCYMVFTNKRLIVARMGLLRELLPYLDVALGAGLGAAIGGAAGAGAGVGGGVASASTSPMTAKLDKERLEELRQISPEQILKSHAKNFDVSYSDIVKIQVGKKLLTPRLYIHTSGPVHRFKFEGVTPEKVESSIRSLIADKIHIERVDKLD